MLKHQLNIWKYFTGFGNRTRKAAFYIEIFNKILKIDENQIVQKVNLYEPLYCFWVGLIKFRFISVPESTEWLIDALNLSKTSIRNTIINFPGYI
jgi:hypothetical protein